MSRCQDAHSLRIFREGSFLRHPSNDFDLVIVAECHRGSVQDESNGWPVLESFDAAEQLSMMATPLRTDSAFSYLSVP